MSKQRIRWIVVLMAIGLLGLVGLQLYWINSALQLQKQQFAYKVTDALQEVVRTLERQEIVYLTKQRIRAREQQNQLMSIAKKGSKPGTYKPIKSQPAAVQTNHLVQGTQPNSAENKYSGARPMIPATTPSGAVMVQSDILHPTVQPLSPEQMAVVEEFFRQQEELMAVGDWQTQLAQQHQFDHWVEHVLTHELTRINSQVDQSAHRQNSAVQETKKRTRTSHQPKSQQSVSGVVTKEEIITRPASMSQHRAQEQSHMIKDVLKGLLLSDRPIEDRVNRLALDTLLRQALTERGIAIPFAYAVRTRQRPQFLFTSLGMDAQQFDDDGYKAALYPNNLMESGNYVYVHFPTQQQFILSQLGFTFGASAVLILVILACFYMAINTIVQQRKLADIKNDFINNMTHELKTPISTISLAVEMAQDQLRPAQAAQHSFAQSDGLDLRLGRYMGIIRDETRRLGSHVEKVLQMALLDRGEIKLNFSQVNVHDVIENVLNNLSLQIEQRGGEVDLNFDAEQEVVEADELHLTNIVYNLLDNALKYSPESPHITLTTRSLPEGVSIMVTDQGVGMTKDQTSRIFEKFYRVPTGNRHDVKGFGLGLSYVKKMIDEHHGQIQVASQLGEGSSFEVILPYKLGETSPPVRS